MRKTYVVFLCVLCVLGVDRRDAAAQAAKAPQRLGIGRPATPEEIAAQDIDIMPDGHGLPAGRGTPAEGETIYAARCAACHGKTGREGPNDRLVGRVANDAFPFARDPSIPHTIGNYWPYATTVFDYIRRAMPPDAPGSLKDPEVYALTAYLLSLNDLVAKDAVMNATTLPKVVMPSRDRFVPDPRGGPSSLKKPGGSPAADSAWQWSGASGARAVSMLIIGDIDIQLRADPTTAFAHIGETLKKADLVYANLEGMLVKPQGPEIDIPDKRGWRHPGPDGVKALNAWNVKVVGVANNVAYDRKNILQTLKVLDANGITHTGAGANIVEAHKPAVVERKGVKIGFLQYTARWYQDEEQIATATEPGVAKISSKDGVTIDPADVERVRDDIRKLRAQVDIVVVSHHNRDGATATQFGAAPPARTPGARRDNHVSEEYQKAFAHLAQDAGADLVYGHGTHTVQGVEVYRGKPILYAVGHSAFDQPGYETSKDGIVVHVAIEGKRIRRVAFVPVTRDANNDVLMLDPASGEGAALVDVIRTQSANTLLRIEGREVVLLDTPVSRPASSGRK